MIANSYFFTLFPGNQTIQTFDDKGNRADLTSIMHFDVMDEEVADHLAWLNDQGAGIFFCVNETDCRGRSSANVIKVRSVYADLDGVPLDKALEYNPSLVVESSPKKYHVYWFVRDVPLEAFKQLQQGIIRVLGSDKAVHDLPRVLRVPGYFHNKKEPYLTHIHSYSGDIFSFKELTYWFPPEKAEQWSAKRYKLDKISSDSKFYGSYGAIQGVRNQHVFRRVCGMIKRRVPWSYIESEANKESLSCSPPLTEQETRLILQSARRYYEG